MGHPQPCWPGSGGLEGLPALALPWTHLVLRPGRQLQPGHPSHAGTAPAGRREWLRFQEAEYKFFEHHSTWTQAQRICTWFRAELASVHSQAELDFLGHNLQKVGVQVCGCGEGTHRQAGEGQGQQQKGPCQH